ncbi:DUF2797 domain-containing protein [Rhodococcoides trifolii]|uniref:DUF2797 domain-containing protein n=1 Tax=Rhodococcoides trifolii TaxID=908250 RepID=UPI001E3F7224|nr:DUF2797 domain-containing protein [Rhodococcus trifolii]
MTELVRGVTWPRRQPELAVSDVETGRTRRIPLDSVFLSFRVMGARGRTYCLGRSASDGNGGSVHIPCPDRAYAVSGSQCDACASKDQFRFVHIVHRQKFVSKDIEAVVMQPHWLYVATFAGGVSKIGTATDTRKWGRLTEQGALVGRYVARGADGRVIRDMEDAVTAGVGLRQAVRASAKAAALARPVDLGELDAQNLAAAVEARELLSGSDFGRDSSIVDETWDPPAGRDALIDAGERLAYPAELSSGAHGFSIRAVVGSAALVTVPADPTTAYVADLSRLKGRRIEFGDYRTKLPPVQAVLF